jgi:hypothetical protein
LFVEPEHLELDSIPGQVVTVLERVWASMGQLFPKPALLSAHFFMVNAIKSVN